MSLILRDNLFDIDRAFEDFFPSGRYFQKANQEQFFSPHVDIVEKDHSYQIRADLPGVKKDDISVQLKDGVLTLQAQRESEEEEKTEQFIRRERRSGKFLRRFNIGQNVVEQDIQAGFNDGVLTIEVPKIKPAKPEVQHISIS